MNSTQSLNDFGESFSTHCRLQSVTNGLLKIMNQQQSDKYEKGNLEWAGNLIGQLDWKSKHYSKEHPELCITATNLRPLFYRTLLKLKIPFEPKFSERIYETLKSCGRNTNLSRYELEQTYGMFKSMAKDSLTELQCFNGLMGNI